MKKISLNRKSIIFKILIPVVLAMFLQVVFFYGSIYLGGTVDQLDQNAYASLNDRNAMRKNVLEEEMISRWSNFDEPVNMLSAALSPYLGEYGAEGVADYEGCLGASVDALLYLLRKNTVNGVYLILTPASEEGTHRYGLYLRDSDPKSTPSDYSDLIIRRAPLKVVEQINVTDKLNIPLSEFDTRFTLDPAQNEGRDAFFYKPLEAYLTYRDSDAKYSDLGYWGSPQYIIPDRALMTYSVPLVVSGKLVGILGVDVEVNYILSNFMDSRELKDGAGSYLLAVEREQALVFEYAASSGRTYNKLFGSTDRNVLDSAAVHENTYRFSDERLSGTVYGNVQYLKLYNSNTPFVNDKWALIAVMEEADLLSFTRSFEGTMVLSVAVSAVLGLLILGLIAWLLTRPLTSLVGRVRSADPTKELKFKRVNIYEVDELLGEIEHLHARIVDSAGKLSDILDLSGMKIGAFEFDKDKKVVFFTEKFFDMFGLPHLEQSFVDAERAQELFKGLNLELEETEENEFVFRLAEGLSARYFRIRVAENELRKIGVVTDVTREIEEKRRIQYERDFDSLTQLFNRQAFWNALGKLFETPEVLKISALLMMDVDNLKFVNDSYGHDLGDEYIRKFGAVLRRLVPYNVLLSRRSGDEFFVFFYGFDSEREIRQLITELRGWLASTYLSLPNGEEMRLRASGGVSWYPKDSRDMEELIKYSDFAMYKIKNSVKGEFLDFNKQDYNRESFLIRGQEQLNQLIDRSLVRYFFQPIVDAATGEVFGYEMLMRPEEGSFFKNPLEVLMVAKAQSKLSKIERLTWLNSLKAFRKQQENAPQDCRIFINSIADQILSREDIRILELLYTDLLPRIVVEFTENEKRVERVTGRKIELARRWGAVLAVDDFGTGYNSETTLLEINPSFVKIDMFIVRNIDKDINRRKIFSTLVAHAHSCGIKVIAEGVETRGELETLLTLGTDYLQGYYLGEPRPEPCRVPEDVRNSIWRTGK